MKRLRGIEKIKFELELEGFDPESPEFEVALRTRRVRKCQEQKEVMHCKQCGYFQWCELAKEHLRSQRYPG